MNETYTINIDAIYGNGWLERNRKELDNYDWEFRAPKEGEKVCSTIISGLSEVHAYGNFSLPRIILKTKKTTLTQVYGSSSIKTPVGYKWTKEFREPRIGDTFINVFERTGICHDQITPFPGIPKNRVILEKLPPTVYFKAEEKPRLPKEGDWFLDHYRYNEWRVSGFDFENDRHICATKHEEPSTYTETITQADLDKLGL